MEEVRDFNRVRCTMRTDDAGHDHEWRADALGEWTALTKRTVIEEMEH